jgi:spoIIIJ-associated protein
VVDGTPETQPGVKQPAEDDVDTLPIEEQAEHAAAFTQDLVRTMGFTATIRTEIDEDDLTVHVDGQNLGALVGPRGATLQALEEVVRAVVQHHAGGHSAWVHVDVGGYKARRRQALEDFARKMAAEVQETGAARQLEPMSAADRKVVHDVITDIDGVATSSEGEDPRRRVVIRPS